MGAPNGAACKDVVNFVSRRCCRIESKDDKNNDGDGDNKKVGEKAPAVHNRIQENNRNVAVAVAFIRSRNIVLLYALQNGRLINRVRLFWLVKVLVFLYFTDEKDDDIRSNINKDYC
jgi:hypothetical protein